MIICHDNLAISTDCVCYLFLHSGPSVALVLCKAGDSLEAGEGAVEQFRNLLGPKDVNTAKEEAPNR